MQSPMSILSVALLLAAGGAIATGASQNTSYVAIGNGEPAIWCAAGGHNYTPIGNPEDYDSLDGWLFSGEPECLVGDVVFGTEDDHAVNGVAVCVAGTTNGRDCGDHRGHPLQVTSNDIVGTPYLELRWDLCDATTPHCYAGGPGSYTETTAGCGAFQSQVPTNLARHWSSPTGTPSHFLWILIHGEHVEPASGTVCLGKSGTLTVAY